VGTASRTPDVLDAARPSAYRHPEQEVDITIDLQFRVSKFARRWPQTLDQPAEKAR